MIIVLGYKATSSITDEEERKNWEELFRALFAMVPMYNNKYYFQTKVTNGKSALKRAENTINKIISSEFSPDIILLIMDNGETLIKKGEREIVKEHFQDIKKVVRFWRQKRKIFLKED